MCGDDDHLSMYIPRDPYLCSDFFYKMNRVFIFMFVVDSCSSEAIMSLIGFWWINPPSLSELSGYP